MSKTDSILTKINLKANSIIDSTLNVFFPYKCIACGKYIAQDFSDEHRVFCVEHRAFYDECRVFCAECKEKVYTVKPPYCPYCHVSEIFCCCRKHSHAYDGAVVPFYYEGAIKDAIKRLKFSAKEHVAVYLGDALGKEIKARFFGIDFDILTCVPTTRQSLAKRGFNQSQSIAENLGITEKSGITDCFGISDQPKTSEHLGNNIEKDFRLLIKTKTTQIQHLLSAETRRRNIETAYHLNRGRNVKDKTILLVDDILTTGATLDACAKELKLQGAKAVYVAVVAVTKMKDEK
ncbi:MAG: ComF family protein [Ruminococcaceae bacterium]|nr:ComF family protein [Oscillospiraceae bacterium]